MLLTQIFYYPLRFFLLVTPLTKAAKEVLQPTCINGYKYDYIEIMAHNITDETCSAYVAKGRNEGE